MKNQFGKNIRERTPLPTIWTSTTSERAAHHPQTSRPFFCRALFFFLKKKKTTNSPALPTVDFDVTKLRLELCVAIIDRDITGR